MPTPLRVLILEDSEVDALWMVHELARADFAPAWRRVETAADYERELSPDLDVVLADFSLPDFDALRALEILSDRGWDVPFVVVTGSVSEEVAVDCLKRGATDYLIKGRLTRLGQAVKQALEARRTREQARQAEAALRESEARYRILVETSPDAILVGDLETRLLMVNAQAVRLLGYDRDEELLGRRGLDLVAHEDRDRAAQAFARLLHEGTLRQIQYSLLRKDGSCFPAEASATLLRDDLGRPKHYLSIVRDITAHRRVVQALASQARFLQSILDHMSDGVALADETGKIVLFNPVARQIVGKGATHRGPNEWSSYYGLFLPDQVTPFPPDQLPLARAVRGETVDRVEIFLRNEARPEGVWLRASARPLLNEHGVASGGMAVFNDITEEKRIQDELRRAKETAEAANRAKSEFLASVSHEIRTPMNGILGMTQLALETELTAEQREYLELVHSSASSLLTVINDVLDFSRIEAGKFQLYPMPFHLRASLREALEILRFRADQKGLDFSWRIDSDVPDRLVGDPARLRQVLLNLVGNAIKFTDRGTVTVRVALDSAQADGAEPRWIVRFEVQDTGIGIAPDQLPRLFEAYYQAEQCATRRHGGTGLGLSISARLVEMMGGRLDVVSTLGKGSTFRFTVPFAPATPASVAPTTEPSTGAYPAPLRILLAEDNLINRKLTVRMLEKRGHIVRTVSNGREVLDLLQRESFDLILMDVQMPEMDGIEATVEIRRREQREGGHVPIIAQTAYAMRDDRERCLQAGMDGYLAKPIQPREMFELIESLIPTAPAPLIPSGADALSSRTRLDANTLLARAGGDAELMADVIRLFLESTSGWLDRLIEAIDCRDAAALREVTHTLKGSALNFAAHAVEGSCRRLSTRAQAGDWSTVPEAFSELRRDLESLCDRLRRIRHELLERPTQAMESFVSPS